MAASMPIGIRIARRRQQLRMTQEELAAQLGVSKSSVANWESGKHFPKRHLGAVEEALGISLTAEPAPPAIPADIMASIRRTLSPAEQDAVIAAIEQTLRGGPPEPTSPAAAEPPAPSRRAG